MASCKFKAEDKFGIRTYLYSLKLFTYIRKDANIIQMSKINNHCLITEDCQWHSFSGRFMCVCVCVCIKLGHIWQCSVLSKLTPGPNFRISLLEVLGETIQGATWKASVLSFFCCTFFGPNLYFYSCCLCTRKSRMTKLLETD